MYGLLVADLLNILIRYLKLFEIWTTTVTQGSNGLSSMHKLSLEHTFTACGLRQ